VLKKIHIFNFEIISFSYLIYSFIWLWCGCGKDSKWSRSSRYV